MGLLDAIVSAGPKPPGSASRDVKKRYSEILSRHLAIEVADGLRSVGFPYVKPERDGPQEKEFQGGLGPKKVDVSYSDEQHGLLLAVSIKSINFAPFGKNLKNRFGDLCTEAITLHMRFPYSLVCALFAFPSAADRDNKGSAQHLSTFRRARKLFATISERADHSSAAEKFENVTMMLFEPVTDSGTEARFELIDTATEQSFTELEYFERLRRLYNRRNPHALIEEE